VRYLLAALLFLAAAFVPVGQTQGDGGWMSAPAQTQADDVAHTQGDSSWVS